MDILVFVGSRILPFLLLISIVTRFMYPRPLMLGLVPKILFCFDNLIFMRLAIQPPLILVGELCYPLGVRHYDIFYQLAIELRRR